MRRSTWVFWIALAACSKGEQDKPAPVAVQGSAARATPPDADRAPEPRPPLLSGKLDEKQGVIFTETRGATVQGLADGTRVEIVAEKPMGVGEYGDGSFTVSYGGKQVELPTDRVLIERDLHRSPDGKYAVFVPVVGCGDACHTVLWIIATDGRRANLGEGGVDVSVAWHPNGDTVAIGNRGLTFVSLADFATTTNDKLTSPAYASDGTLYARDHDGSAYKLDGDKATRVWKAKKRKLPEGMPDLDPPPVSFKDGKPTFEIPY